MFYSLQSDKNKRQRQFVEQGVAGYAPQVARPQNADVGWKKDYENTPLHFIAGRLTAHIECDLPPYDLWKL